MTYDELVKVNETIKTTDIKDKDYATVNERIRVFRMLYPNGAITTEITYLENGMCVIKASAFDDNGKILGVGHAYEKEGNGFINKTSYIENCETSAVGRALGMIGIGISVSMASYEEVANAQLQQSEQEAIENSIITEAELNTLKAIAKKKGQTFNAYKGTKIEALTYKKYRQALKDLEALPDAK